MLHLRFFLIQFEIYLSSSSPGVAETKTTSSIEDDDILIISSDDDNDDAVHEEHTPSNMKDRGDDIFLLKACSKTEIESISLPNIINTTI